MSCGWPGGRLGVDVADVQLLRGCRLFLWIACSYLSMIMLESSHLRVRDRTYRWQAWRSWLR